MIIIMIAGTIMLCLDPYLAIGFSVNTSTIDISKYKYKQPYFAYVPYQNTEVTFYKWNF